MQKVADIDDIPQDVLNLIRAGRVTGQWNAESGRIEFRCEDGRRVVGAWEGQAPQVRTAPPAEEVVGKETKGSQSIPPPASPAAVAAPSTTAVSLLIARSLALQPLTPTALLGAVCALDPALDKELVRSAIREDTIVLARGLVDLRPGLLSAIRIDWFDKEADKKRAANRIAPMLHRIGASFDTWHAHIDRDVYLDLHSSGGIMSGMAAAAPFGGNAAVEDAADEADASAGGEPYNANGKRLATASGQDDEASRQQQRRRRVEDAIRDLQDVDWLGGGDLAKPPVVVPGGIVKRLTTAQSQRRERSNAATATAHGTGVCALPISTLEELEASRDVSGQLLDALVALDDRLRQHEQLCSKVRHILQQHHNGGGPQQPEDNSDAASSNNSNRTDLLASSIADWLQGQLPLRTPLLLLHRDLRSELSQRIREEQTFEYLQDLLSST